MTEGGTGASGRMVWLRYRIGAEIGGEDGKRLEELEEASAHRGMQLEEMAEMRRIYEKYGAGGFLEGPEFTRLGVTDPETFYENLGFILGYAEHAYESQFALEAVSLRVLLLDFMLRCYVVQKTGESIEPYSDQDRLTFGQAIGRAEDHGLPKDIVKDLRTFNKKRNAGVHHFVLGRTTYQEIADSYREADGLFERIADAMSLPQIDDF